MRSSKIIKYSAPQSIVLSGEFGDIYGKPVLSAAINQRLYFSIWKERNKQTNDKQIKQIADEVKKYLIAKNVKIIEQDFNIKIEEDDFFKNESNLSPLIVSSTAAFLEFFSGVKFDKEEISKLAYKIEKQFDKQSLGYNIANSCFGGLVYFRKEFEFLKNISKFQFKIPKNIEGCLYLIRLPERTNSQVSQTKIIEGLYNNDSKKVEAILNNIEKSTKRMVVAIAKEDKEFFKKTLKENEQLLEKLGVCSKLAVKLINKMERLSVSQILGSNYILVFAENKNKLEYFCLENKITSTKFKLSFEGLMKKN